MLDEKFTICGIITPTLLGGTESRFVLSHVKGVSSAGLGEAFFVCIYTEVIAAIRDLEELLLAGVALHVTPPTALPPTRDQMQLLIHRDFCIHQRELLLVDFSHCLLRS